MELDKRSCHWIVTRSWPTLPLPTDDIIPRMNAKFGYAIWSNDNKLLSVWYTFEHAQRASTLTNNYDCDIVIKRCKLEDLVTFKELPREWNFDWGSQLTCQLPTNNQQDVIECHSDDEEQLWKERKSLKRKIDDIRPLMMRLDKVNLLLRNRLDNQ